MEILNKQREDAYYQQNHSMEVKKDASPDERSFS